MSYLASKTLLGQNSHVKKRRDARSNWIIMLTILAVFSPLGFLTALGCYAVFTVWKYSWKVNAAATAIYALLFTVLGGFTKNSFSSYFQPWGDMWGAMRDETISETIQANLFSWIFVNQLWVSLLAGGIVGTAWTAWKWANRPKWDSKLSERRLSPVGEIKKKKNIHNIACDLDTPESGRTLGIDKEGNRVVQGADEAKAHTFITGGSGAGKALDAETLIPTPTGFTKMGLLQPGDQVFNEYGTPITVDAVYDVQNNRDCFTVHFDAGEEIVADGEHLWVVVDKNGYSHTLTTTQIVEQINDGETFTVRGTPAAVTYDTRELPVPAELVGAWLKHNTNRNVGTVATLTEDLNAYVKENPKNPWTKTSRGETVFTNTFTRLTKTVTENGTVLPDEYLFNSVADRTSLLHAMSGPQQFPTPTGYHCAKTMITIQKGTTLHCQIRSLLHSLALTPLYDTTGNITGWGSRDTTHRTITSITRTESVPVRCIHVNSPTNLFLAGIGYVPTHNTTTMMIGVRDHIKRREPVLFVDLKGAADVPEQLAEWCSRYNVPFYHWIIHDQRAGYHGPAERAAYYDPIGRGDPSRKKDLIMGSQKMENEYYRSISDNYLQLAFQLAEYVPDPNPNASSLETLTKLLDLNYLSTLAQTLFIDSEKTAEGNTAVAKFGDKIEWWNHVDEIIDDDIHGLLRAVSVTVLGLNSDERARGSVHNMNQRMQTLLRSTGGTWLRKDPKHTHDIDFRRIVEEGGVALFSLDTANYEIVSASIGTLIIQDLKTFSGEMRQNPPKNPLNVYIDEFSAMESDNIIGLLNKSRDAYVPVTLSTQTLADLAKMDPSFQAQLMGVVNCFIIHRANTEEDAIVYAGLTGKDSIYKERLNVERQGSGAMGSATGSGSIEEKEEYRVSPSIIQDLEPGQMVFIAKAPKRRILEKIQVIMEDPAQMFLASTNGDKTHLSLKKPRRRTETTETAHPARTSRAVSEQVDATIEETPKTPHRRVTTQLRETPPLPQTSKWGDKKKKNNINVEGVLETSEWEDKPQKRSEQPADNTFSMPEFSQPRPNHRDTSFEPLNSEEEYVWDETTECRERPRRATPLINPDALRSRRQIPATPQAENTHSEHSNTFTPANDNAAVVEPQETAQQHAARTIIEETNTPQYVARKQLKKPTKISYNNTTQPSPPPTHNTTVGDNEPSNNSKGLPVKPVVMPQQETSDTKKRVTPGAPPKKGTTQRKPVAPPKPGTKTSNTAGNSTVKSVTDKESILNNDEW